MFIKKEAINNRTGNWYVGVMSLADSVDIDTVSDGGSCASIGLTKDWFSSDFLTVDYLFQAYTGGAYSFNATTEVWESIGVTVYNSTKLITGCGVTHLTSFGSGWFPQVNTIDFEFVFAAASFQVLHTL